MLALTMFVLEAPALAGPTGAANGVDYDLNDDTKSDVLTQAPGGAVGAVQIDGVGGLGTLFFGTASGSETVIGSGDFDDDTQAEAVVRNASTGVVRIVDLQASLAPPSSSAYIFTSPSQQLFGIGQVDGDLYDDLVFYNPTTGAVFVVLINNDFSVKASGYPAFLGANEVPVGVGNVNDADGGDLVAFDTVTLAARVIPLATSGLATAGPSFYPLAVAANRSVTGLAAVNDDSRLDFIVEQGAGAPTPGLIRIAFTGAGGTSISGDGFPLILPSGVGLESAGNYDGTGATDLMALSSGSSFLWSILLDNAAVATNIGYPAPVAGTVVGNVRAN
jgi:hypothetical protein